MMLMMGMIEPFSWYQIKDCIDSTDIIILFISSKFRRLVALSTANEEDWKKN